LSIKERAKKDLDEALKEYMEKSQGHSMPFMDEAPGDNGESGAGQQGMSGANQGKADSCPKKAVGGGDMTEDIDSLKERMDALEKTINLNFQAFIEYINFTFKFITHCNCIFDFVSSSVDHN